MTSPTRSVVVKLSLDPSSYVAGAAAAREATLGLDRAASQTGDHASTSLDKAAKAAAKSAAEQKAAADDVVRSNDKVKLSAEEAAHRIADVRTELVELGQKKIGVDVDTVDARMRLTELRGKLDEIAAEKPSARVQADIDAATVQLRTVQAQLNRIDGQTVTATVDVDDHGSAARAASGLDMLRATAWSVSPALIPIGAAATAGLAGIPGLAIAGASGLGVLISTIAGVSSAVKLLGQQEEAAQSVGARAGGGGASSAAALRSAQASLANTRANAADAAVRAAEQVANAERQASQSVQSALGQQQQAERNLATAQRDELTAQKDLTAARRTAKQQLEDLANQVTDNALAQRQAVLDVAAAKKALDQTLDNAGATDAQREQAQITYRQQLQQQSELALAGQRLADQQADAARKGVAGADVVTAAQQKVADAQQKVSDATVATGRAATAVDQARADGAQKVADAVRDQSAQQRQALFSIAQAQDAVTNAMHGSGASGVSALDGINRKLAELDPATRAFATYLMGTWKPVWSDLRAAAAGGLLPGAREGLEAIRPLMPELIGMTGELSHTMGDLAAEGGQALAGPFWQQFFAMVRRDAGPLMTDMAHTAGNIAHGFVGMAEAFEPMALQVGGGIEDLTGKFARWGEELKDSEGWRKFVAYVRTEAPEVAHLVENVGSSVVHLVQAAAPLGAGTLGLLVQFSSVLAGLPIGVVNGLVDAFLAFKVGGAASTAISGMTDGARKLVDSLDGLGKKAPAVTSGLGGWASAGESSATGLSKVASMLGKVGGAIPVVGLGVGVLTGALELASSAVEEHRQKLAADTQQLLDWRKAQDQGGQAGAEAAQKLADKRNELAAAQAKLNQMLADADGIYASQGENASSYTAQIEVQKDKVNDLKTAYDGMQKSYEHDQAGLSAVQIAQQKVTEARNDYTQALKNNPPNSDAVVSAAGRLRDAQNQLAGAQERENTAQKSHLQLLQEQASKELGAIDSGLAAQQAQLSLNESVADYVGKTKTGKLHGDALASAQNAMAQSALSAARAAAQVAADQAKANGVTDTSTVSQQAMLRSLQAVAAQLGQNTPDAIRTAIAALEHSSSTASITAAKMKDLGLAVKGIPDDKTVIINAPTEEQRRRLEGLGYTVSAIPGTKDVSITANVSRAQTELQSFIDQHPELTVQLNFGIAHAVDTIGQALKAGLHLAQGGVVHAYANGGLEPMAGGVAKVVAPNTWRVIGDRVDVDEFYIPDNSDSRSLAIGREYVRRHPEVATVAAPVRTRELVATGAGGGGAAPIDYRQLAAAVAAAIPDRPTVHVDRWDSTAGQTPYENAEAITFALRTR